MARACRCPERKKRRREVRHLPHGDRSAFDDKDLGRDQQALAAGLHSAAELPHDLARVVEAWGRLPDAIKSAILLLAGEGRKP